MNIQTAIDINSMNLILNYWSKEVEPVLWCTVCQYMSWSVMFCRNANSDMNDHVFLQQINFNVGRRNFEGTWFYLLIKKLMDYECRLV